MNIKATLARLDSRLNGEFSACQLLLLPGRGADRPLCPPPSADESLEALTQAATQDAIHQDAINIVVGYNGSAKSQVALDLALLIAYQTRLATRKQVVVQTVYVLDGIYPTQNQVLAGIACPVPTLVGTEKGAASTVVTERRSQRHRVNCVDVRAAQLQYFEEADQVLWKARNFATEWRGSLNTHLRFGSPAVELGIVAEQEQAHVLIVGCPTGEHPLILQLSEQCPCPVLGIPQQACPDADWTRN